MDVGNPFISVVVPIYNSERFLRGAGMLDSLLHQTFRDIEIILVDDGSSDDSLKICQEFAASDNRIVVISQANGGEASARNAGMRAARGEYLSVVDHDDYLERDAYEVLGELAIRFRPDIVRCNFRTTSRGVDIATCAQHPYAQVLDRHYIRHNILPAMIGVDGSVGKRLPGHWTYLHRRDMLISRGIQYDYRKRKETDHRFIVEALDAASSLVLTERCLYQFVKHAGSNTSNYSPRFDNIMDSLAFYEKLFIGEYDFRNRAKVAYGISFIEECVFYVLIHEGDVADKRKEILRILRDERVSGRYSGLGSMSLFSSIVRALVLRRHYNLAYGVFEVAFLRSRLVRLLKGS